MSSSHLGSPAEARVRDGSVTFIVNGAPKPKGSLRHVGRGRLIEQVQGSSDWRADIAMVARREWRRPPCAGPVRVTLAVLCPRPQRPRSVWAVSRATGDIDKHARQVLDALTGVCWVDDAQVVRLQVSKEYGPPGVRVTVAPLDELAQAGS